MDHLVFEVGTALALIAIAAVLANRIKLSIIPVMIVLGMMMGPHMFALGIFDFRFEESTYIINFLGRMGVLFLLFYLGLEFSVGKLVKSGRPIIFGGSLYVGANFTLGLAFGFFSGFPLYETLVVAGLFAVSSSAIVAKVLVDLHRTGNKETELILGMILVDDIFLAVYLSVMSGLLLGGGTSFGEALISILISIGYMTLFFVVARKGVAVLDKMLDITSNETFILVVFAAMFFVAGFSETIHVAEAIGALLFGLALSETKHSHRIEHMVVPFRDFLGAIFFFSFGLSIDPFSLKDAFWLAGFAALLTLISNVVVGMIAGRNAGLTHRASLNIGLTMSARGEFSIIIANLGLAAGLSKFLMPFSAVYVLALAIVGPLLTKQSSQIYDILNSVFKWAPHKAVTKEKKSKDIGGEAE
jgi:CPA2 family monovalent cation:H+ antiporter-2